MRIRTIIAAAAAPLALTGIALSATAASASTAVPTAVQLSAAHVWTAKTQLISRPDSGGAGNTWANDTMTRTLTIRLNGSTGSGTSTVYYYSANVKDAGKFRTVNGALTPTSPGRMPTRRRTAPFRARSAAPGASASPLPRSPT